jgi:crossover junction endodeoxyribonuclease RusA
LAKLPKGCEKVDVTLTWHPRARFRTDALNLAPMLKAATDGLVDYGLIPDDTPQYITEHCRIGEPAQPAHFLLDIEVVTQ